MAEVSDPIKKKRRKNNTNCCVYGCNSKGKANDNSLHFHHFPRGNREKVNIVNKLGTVETLDRRLAWNKVLLRSTPASNYMRVCSRHFKESDYFLSGHQPEVRIRKSLKKTAVPSRNLPIYIPRMEPNLTLHFMNETVPRANLYPFYEKSEVLQRISQKEPERKAMKINITHVTLCSSSLVRRKVTKSLPPTTPTSKKVNSTQAITWKSTELLMNQIKSLQEKVRKLKEENRRRFHIII